MKKSSNISHEVINFKGMQYAPQGELGVVFLFSKLQRDLGYASIIRISDTFPDCEALKYTGKRVQIEFEFRSKNFLVQHKPKGLKRVKSIICWEDNWPPRKRNLLKKHRVEIIELRRSFGLGRIICFHVVRKAYQKDYLEWLNRGPKTDTLPCHQSAKKGDLMLDYIGAPESYIKGMELLTSDAYPAKSGNFPYRAKIRRIATLKTEVHMSNLKSEKSLVGAFFLKQGGLEGWPRVNEYWPQISTIILRRNKTLAAKIKRFITWD